jgi:hypothetical protein
MIARLLQRWNDWLHERAIKAASSDVIRYGLRGQTKKERAAYAEMCALVRSRSPQQIERMERAQGIYRGSNQNN